MSPDDILSGQPCRPLPLPDLRSPDSIERDVADKESKLAEVDCFLFLGFFHQLKFLGFACAEGLAQLKCLTLGGRRD